MRIDTPKFKEWNISAADEKIFQDKKQHLAILSKTEKSFFDYLYFMVIHCTENKIIALLKSKKVPFKPSYNEDGYVILRILKSEYFSIADHVLQTSLKYLIDDLLQQIYIESDKATQERYKGVIFEKVDLQPLIIQIILSKCKTILQNKNINLRNPVKNGNSYHPKCFIEYHLQEFLEYLDREGRERTAKEKIEHQSRRQFLLREYGAANGIVSIVNKLKIKIFNFAHIDIVSSSNNKINVIDFIRNAKYLNNHLLFIINDPILFSANEIFALKALQQTIFSAIEKTSYDIKKVYDIVQEASEDSFPASDPPCWTLGKS